MLLIAGFACQAQNQIDKQGRKQGHWIKTDKNGAKIYEGDFVNDLETGTFLYYYPNGQVRIKNTYTIDGKVCNHEAFDKEGHRLASGQYNQKNRDGKWEFFSEAGNRIKITTYKMGVKDGPQVVFDRKGDTVEVTNYSDNHRNGRWWKRIGTKGYITATYIKGGLEGTLVEYDDNGNLAREGHYHNGIKNGSYRYYEDGHLVVDEIWADGLMAEKLVRMLAPKEQMVSIYDIACMIPQGRNKVIVYLEDGTKLIDLEPYDQLYNHTGSDIFGIANKKNHVMVAIRMIKGITKDDEGREILNMNPMPDVSIFPDEDCMKLIQVKRYKESGIMPGENE